MCGDQQSGSESQKCMDEQWLGAIGVVLALLTVWPLGKIIILVMELIDHARETFAELCKNVREIREWTDKQK